METPSQPSQALSASPAPECTRAHGHGDAVLEADIPASKLGLCDGQRREDGTKLEYDATGMLDPLELLELRETLKGTMLVSFKTTKGDQLGAHWSKYQYPIPLEPADSTAVVKTANFYIDLEYADPAWSREERETTPIFRHPRTKKRIRTEAFNEVVIQVLFEALNKQGQHLSIHQVRKMYSLHSFRIGGNNALRAAGVPREIRMILGRWKCDAIDTYSRTDIELFANFLRDSGVSCKPFQTLADDLPYHEESVGVKYGQQFGVATEDDEPLPKVVPEITIKEASIEMNFLCEAWEKGDPEFKRNHSLVGRKIELELEEKGGQGEQAATIEGEVVGVEPRAEDGLQYQVRFEGGETARYSVFTICDHLIPVPAPTRRSKRPPPPPPPQRLTPQQPQGHQS